MQVVYHPFCAIGVHARDTTGVKRQLLVPVAIIGFAGTSSSCSWYSFVRRSESSSY